MKRKQTLLIATTGLLAALGAALWPPALPAAEPAAQPAAAHGDYRAVKTILVEHCKRCHGATHQKGGLRLDSWPLLMKGGNGGAVVEAGDASKSRLLMAVRGQGKLKKMPAEGKELTSAQIATLEGWIASGAAGPADEQPEKDPRQHWAFQKPTAQSPPSPAANPEAAWASEWVRNPIDSFIAAELAARGLKPAPAADRRTLVRRIYLDLIGMPPTPQQARAFEADDSPGAYERLVDELLASPAYGERWGRHWMDVWRYSDWSGYQQELRNSAKHIWRWRDWIVQSLNGDLPYSRMVELMLAADELAPDDQAAQAATGFVARNYYKFNRNVWLDDAVEHTAKGLLGITMNCARCHDHMYDPIAQQDYYRFRAIFEPHQVRTDQMGMQADLNLDGMARVFDAKPQEPTYLFVRGNDAQPVKDKKIEPGVPESLGGAGLSVRPVKLPASAYYPGLRPHVRAALVKAATENVAKKEAELDKAAKALLEAEEKFKALEANGFKLLPVPAAPVPPAPTDKPAKASKAADPKKKTPAAGDKPAEPAAADPLADPVKGKLAAEKRAEASRLALVAAEAAVKAAMANLDSINHRIQADDVRYQQIKLAQGEQPGERGDRLALAASGAMRASAEAAAAAEVALRKKELAEAELAAITGGADKAKAAETARQKLAADQKKLLAAQAERAKPATKDYAPLTPLHPATSTGRRAALAHWVTDRENPLTARVAVNHLWMRHFGRPLVESTFDFGLHGRAPSHPKLLDWLAMRLMDGGWSMKDLHRLMVTSATYQLTSETRGGDGVESSLSIDPDNHWLWRFNSRRMEGEVVRDSLLQVAGRLDRKMGGPELDQNSDQTTWRRGIYYRHAHEKYVTMLAIFDGPKVAECYRRAETIVPQQALALANSPLAQAAARELAGRLHQQAQAAGDGREAAGPEVSDGRFAGLAFEAVLGRPATDDETRACVEFLTRQRTMFKEAAGAGKMEKFTTGPAAAKPAADPALRARENLAHVLLNHHQFVMIR